MLVPSIGQILVLSVLLRLFRLTLLLSDYFANVPRNPTEPDRVALCERITRMPHCEFCTPKRLYQYFYRMRKMREGEENVPRGSCES